MLQECLKLSLESSVIPAFELSCKEMFKQVDSAFRKGMFKHTIASQQQFDSAHSSLATTLKVCNLLSKELTSPDAVVKLNFLVSF